MDENLRSIHALPASITPAIGQMIEQFANDTKRLLQENLWAEYLFGSYATNRQTPASDIDILIIVKHLTPDLQRQVSGLAADYSLTYNMYISPIVQDRAVWEKNQQYQTLFYQDVVQQGIRL
jgi:predicted nucleotidyltransferase